MREGVLRILDSISAPAYVHNNRMDILAANRLGQGLFADVYADGAAGFNHNGDLRSAEEQRCPGGPVVRELMTPDPMTGACSETVDG